MHDIVIRGGTIIDGTGKPAFGGDVAIADGRIAGVVGNQGPAHREIDADGCAAGEPVRDGENVEERGSGVVPRFS